MNANIQEKLERSAQMIRQGNLAGAEALCRQVIVEEPDRPEAFNLLGVIEMRANRPAQAISLIQKAISLHPLAEYQLNLARVLQASGRFEEAAAAYRQCAKMNPMPFEATCALGDALLDLDQPAEAAAVFRQCMLDRPESMIGLTGLGSALLQMGDLEQALESCDEALARRPDWPVPHCNKGCILLSRGDYERGWTETEWRWQMPSMQKRQAELGKPRWDGGDISGRKILIHAEAGVGDTLNFLRYIPLVAERGGRVLFRCQPELRALLGGTAGVDRFVEPGEENPEFDVHCAMMSLPAVFQSNEQTIPPPRPLLAAERAGVERWKRRMPGTGRVKVGVVWSGRIFPPSRAVPLRMLEPIGELSNLWLCSLQKGEAARQLFHAPPSLNMSDWTDELNNFGDTAALIANLDLVIAVDTSVAHLAGAMGKPVWVLLKHTPDWRWMLSRNDSPWYPTMRLFRQETFGDWSKPVAALTEALRNL